MEELRYFNYDNYSNTECMIPQGLHLNKYWKHEISDIFSITLYKPLQFLWMKLTV
jgi:hypothetical protein